MPKFLILLMPDAESVTNIELYSNAAHLENTAFSKLLIHRNGDAWQDIIRAWLCAPDCEGKLPINKDFILISDVLRHALSLDVKHVNRADEFRIGKILRAIGFEKVVRRVKGKSRKVWVHSVTSVT